MKRIIFNFCFVSEPRHGRQGFFYILYLIFYIRDTEKYGSPRFRIKDGKKRSFQLNQILCYHGTRRTNTDDIPLGMYRIWQLRNRQRLLLGQC